MRILVTKLHDIFQNLLCQKWNIHKIFQSDGLAFFVSFFILAWLQAVSLMSSLQPEKVESAYLCPLFHSFFVSTILIYLHFLCFTSFTADHRSSSGLRITHTPVHTIHKSPDGLQSGLTSTDGVLSLFANNTTNSWIMRKGMSATMMLQSTFPHLKWIHAETLMSNLVHVLQVN